MTNSLDNFRPVVAFDVDGVIRVRPSDDGTLLSFPITMRQDEYPTLFHGKPRWNEAGESTSVEYFTKAGVDLLKRTACDSSFETVWATTWQRWANLYFGGPLGIPELPVAVKTLHPEGQNWYHCSPSWKSDQLSRQFDGRPLIWIDDSAPDRPDENLIYNRRPIDRAITLFYKVDGWTGLTAKDVIAIEEWLALASSPEGHKILRARRVKEEAAKRAERAKWSRENDRKHAHFKQIFAKVIELYPGQEYLARDLGSMGQHKEGLTSENVGYALKRHSIRADPDELSAKLRIRGYHRKYAKPYDYDLDF
jgi:hypothetical protein